ncbi:hypothetical protein [Caballeronia grimmiae]|uniref:CAAX protease n=1 Tax=Caballeronia grimmiae TaxID=1071679 RepID=A0A069NE75_9BURK|nr:hypothetical protein [Caballeronia grimmiae]KDR26678.1 hypothetical protein BG57_25935 [Caballeronia grimmiae]GGD96684.1 hypothetical protein GCM10010985_59210 [Caballeronia grimmiae]
MSLALTQAELDAISLALSPARLGTYIQAAANAGNNDALHPIKLYGWNAQLSGAFLTPLQICEVTVRNGICDGIERRYGADWPWVAGFERTLPAPRYGFNPQRELIDTRRKFAQGETGKVIAELKMAFWSQMLTQRHDGRLWTPFLRAVFPNLPDAHTVAQCRTLMGIELEKLRKLRNRIAHHEPIISYNLLDFYASIRSLVSWRCKTTAGWMDSIETITAVVKQKP